MTNRQRVIEAVKASTSKKLRDDIDYYLDSYSDTPGYDEADALNDCLNFAEASNERGMIRTCIDILIAAGYYRPRDCGVFVMGRDRSPTRGGVRYDCVDAWCIWIDG